MMGKVANAAMKNKSFENVPMFVLTNWCKVGCTSFFSDWLELISVYLREKEKDE
jgi:hypothetical protein